MCTFWANHNAGLCALLPCFLFCTPEACPCSALCLVERCRLQKESSGSGRGLALGLAFPGHSMLSFRFPCSCCWSVGHGKQPWPDLSGPENFLHQVLADSLWVPVRQRSPVRGLSGGSYMNLGLFYLFVSCFLRVWLCSGYGFFFINPNQLGKVPARQVFLGRAV